MIDKENSIHLPQKCSSKALNDDSVSQRNQNTLKLLSFIWLRSGQSLSEHLRAFLATFDSLRKVIGNLRESLGHFRKSGP